MPEPGDSGERVDVEGLEARAEGILAGVPKWIWDGESLPVPVEDIADSCFGIYVRDVEDLATAPGCPPLEDGQTLSGLLLAARGEIWVNAAEAREWPPRRRFTIGHELGHWVMHRAGDESLFCRSATVQPADPELDEPDIPDIEEEASAFAAALLMPARLIREHYARVRDHAEMCELFEASGAAMGRRLHAVIEPGD
ncbi:MAG: ImmA/IrrE family metallo-endopeptidase [Solirubrobacterales bacterium]